MRHDFDLWKCCAQSDNKFVHVNDPFHTIVKDPDCVKVYLHIRFVSLISYCLDLVELPLALKMYQIRFWYVKTQCAIEQQICTCKWSFPHNRCGSNWCYGIFTHKILQSDFTLPCLSRASLSPENVSHAILVCENVGQTICTCKWSLYAQLLWMLCVVRSIYTSDLSVWFHIALS